MIYCVVAEKVDRFLFEKGFTHVATREHQRIFRGPQNELLILPEPNINGHLPEAIVASAFNTTGIDPPDFAIFYCD